MPDHNLRITRKPRGMTPIRPSRPLYATVGRCTCGWETKDNNAPSRGGRKAVEQLHREHMAAEVSPR